MPEDILLTFQENSIIIVCKKEKNKSLFVELVDNAPNNEFNFF